jgi:hypothetical protein
LTNVLEIDPQGFGLTAAEIALVERQEQEYSSRVTISTEAAKRCRVTNSRL